MIWEFSCTVDLSSIYHSGSPEGPKVKSRRTVTDAATRSLLSLLILWTKFAVDCSQKTVCLTLFTRDDFVNGNRSQCLVEINKTNEEATEVNVLLR